MGNIMGTVRWADPERTIVIWTFADSDTTETILETTRAFTAMIQSVPHPTRAVVDCLHLPTVPRETISMFPMLERLLPQGDRRPNVIGIVSNQRVITTMIDLFAKVYPGYKERFVGFQSVAEALAYLQAR